MTLASSELASEAPQLRRDVVDLEERTWLARHRRGDSSAFPALMAAYRRPVYSYLVRSGVAGAGRIGAGLGGAVAIFVKSDSASALLDRLTREYYEPNGLPPSAEIVRPLDGAEII